MMEESLQRGSFELYDNTCAGKPVTSQSLQQANLLNLKSNISQSNGYVPDYKEAFLKSQHELQESKNRETDLLRLLNHQEVRPVYSSYGQADEAVGSSSQEPISEYVKDGQIKHLQRQLTILQANLYKSERWADKHAIVMNERDSARDENIVMAAQMSQLQADNDRLKQEVKKLNSSYLELQQKLRMMSSELSVQDQHENCKQQMRMLQEELKTKRLEIAALRESQAHLSQENKSLRENSESLPSNKSMASNPACTQELDYLHKVVDTLKNTVLEQRKFLMTMKTTGHSITDESSTTIVDQPQETIKHIPEVTPPKAKGFFSKLKNLPGSTASKKQPSLTPRESSQTEEVVKISAGLSSPISPHKMSTKLDVRGAESGIITRGIESDLNTRPSSSVFQPECDYVRSPSYRTPDISLNNPVNVNSDNNLITPNMDRIAVNLHESELQEEKPKMQTEIISRQNPGIDPRRTKTETITRNPGSLALQETGKTPLLNQIQTGASSGSTGFPGYVYQNRTQNKPKSHEVHLADIGQYVKLQDPNSERSKFMAPLSTHGLPIVNQDRMSGGRILLNGEQNLDKVSKQVIEPVTSPIGPMESSSRDRLTSDRLCPVCNVDFSHVTMEAFQAHVFECFDDENAPETMKPVASIDRNCPMCGAKFGQNTSQDDYEKHVHGHFGEERAGDNFEIVQP